MIKLKSEVVQQPSRPRRSRFPWIIVLLVLIPPIVLAVERWRGQWALADWKRQALAKGEVFEVKQLWPPPPPESLEFSNRLALVISQVPRELYEYFSSSSLVFTQSGQARRGSQEPHPAQQDGTSLRGTWRDLEALIARAKPSFDSLRNLAQDSLPERLHDVAKHLENDSFPNYLNARVSAQALHAAAMNDLHQGNLAGAHENLKALLAFTRLNAEDSTLVSFMIRVAILGLSVDVCWDALQAEGWTEEQLASLQQACESVPFLSQMPKLMEAERASRMLSLKRLRLESYDDWCERYQEIIKSFGWKPVDSGTVRYVRSWRQWVFHPLWQFAWADQEELHYLETMQDEIATLREVPKHKSWITLSEQMAGRYQSYVRPRASWRFYTELPIIEKMSESGGTPHRPASYPGPHFARAWLLTMENLTLNQMVTATIALKRYKIRHGNMPSSLASLVPEFLPSVPCDYMDGQPLRYRVTADGSFVLYSVAEDGVDGGGDPSPPEKSGPRPAAWPGRDWVWPK